MLIKWIWKGRMAGVVGMPEIAYNCPFKRKPDLLFPCGAPSPSDVSHFVKAAGLQQDYLGCLVLSSWYPLNQGLLLISTGVLGNGQRPRSFWRAQLP